MNEPMSDERFNWLRDYLAPLPRSLAPLTQECVDEIGRLRDEAEKRSDWNLTLTNKIGSLQVRVAELEKHNHDLQAMNTQEVERRRKAETDLKALEAIHEFCLDYGDDL